MKDCIIINIIITFLAEFAILNHRTLQFTITNNHTDTTLAVVLEVGLAAQGLG